MPLPASEESRIELIFEAVFYRVNEMIHKLIADENERRFYRSLLIGGNAMSKQVVTKCEGVKKTWGEGDETKALALTKLFTLLMLSQCCRWIAKTEPDSDEKQKDSRKMAASKVLSFFEDDCRESIESFLNMDAQFKYDSEHENHMTHMGIFILAKACEACSHKCIEWSKVSFPIKSMKPLASSRVIINSALINNLNDITVMWNCHATSVQVTMKYYEDQA